MELSKVPLKTKGIPWQKFGKGVVILQSQTNEVHELNETAGSIWNKIDGLRTMGQIKDEILKEFEVSEEDLKKDLNLIVEALSSKGLITW